MKKNGFDDRFRHGFRRHHFAARGVGPERVPDVGVGGAGEKSDDSDSARAKLLAQCVGESESGVLGGIVGGGSGED